MSKKVVGGIIAIITAIAAAIVGATVNIKIEEGKVNATITYSQEEVSPTITDEGEIESIETGQGEIKVEGEKVQTVESVENNGPVTGDDVSECPEGEECGRGAAYPKLDISSPQAFANQTLGVCLDVDGYFGSQSLVAGTQILMYNGEYRNVENIHEGDLIMSADGKTTNHVANNTSTPEEIYEVETPNGYIRGTAGHRVFVDGQEIALKDLKEGMIIDSPEYKGIDLGLSEDEYKFLGMWLGDGTYHVVRNKYSEIFVTVGTDEKAQYMRNLNLEMTERQHSNGKATIFYLKTSEKQLYDVISQYSGKNIPTLSEGSEQVIEGFIVADGSQRKDDGIAREGQFVISNTNRSLLASIQDMAWQNGYTAKLSKPIVREKTNLSDNPATLYRLSINKQPQRKQDRGKVIKVVATGETQNVYHLNVWEENHSYIADGLAHHNCWDSMSAFFYNYVGRVLQTCGTGAAKGTIADGCWQKNAGSDFTMIWDATQIQPGDIAVYSTGTWGHIGMAMGYYNNGYFTLLGQNQGGTACPGGGAAGNIINLSTRDFIGAFRPNIYIAPEPEPEPEPEPAPVIPLTGCSDWNVVAGDTMIGIGYACENVVLSGEALDKYADGWISQIYNPGNSVYYGWTHGTGYGLYAGDYLIHDLSR